MVALVKSEKTNLISFFRKKNPCKLQCYKHNSGTVHVHPVSRASRCMVLISVSISLEVSLPTVPNRIPGDLFEALY